MIKYDSKCTGCGACMQKCPKNCIKMEIGDLGFKYPVVDENLCIKCNLCDKVCPIDKEVETPEFQKLYAVSHDDTDVLMKSTSGGFFTAIAEWVIKKGGIVYGCAYDENLFPITIGVESIDGLEKLRGSKYVQSDTTSIYKDIELNLKNDRTVLFTGTPCQVDGLKKFLGKDYSDLITCDLICHGVPSSKYFLDYIHYLECKTNMKIQDFSFRDKANKGWGLSGTYSGISNKNRKHISKKLFYFNSYYYSYFLAGEIYRESCYTCKYANMNRVGDFTLGDFWGVEALNIPFSTENGCSLIVVNSEKGEEIFKNLKIHYQEVEKNSAIQYNGQLSNPSSKPDTYSVRCKEYEAQDIENIEKVFFKTHAKQNFVGRIKYSMPLCIKKMLLKVKYSRKKNS